MQECSWSLEYLVKELDYVCETFSNESIIAFPGYFYKNKDFCVPADTKIFQPKSGLKEISWRTYRKHFPEEKQ